MIEALQDIINATPDGSNIKLAPGETYSCDEQILMQDRHGIIIDGTGAYLRREIAPPHGWFGQRQLQLIGCSDITIKNLAVKGPKPDSQGYNPDLESQHGIAIDSSLNVTVDHCTIQRTWGDGIYVSGNCKQVTIIWNSIAQSGRHNVTFTAVDGFILGLNRLDLAHRHTVDLEPGRSDEYVQNGTIALNTFSRTNLLPSLNIGGPNVRLDTLHIGGNSELH